MIGFTLSSCLPHPPGPSITTQPSSVCILVCVKGTTGRDINYGKDCNNVCNGTARNDSCGVCSNPPANNPESTVSPFVDCNNDCFQSASLDSCGNCTGGLTGRAPNFWMDGCGELVSQKSFHKSSVNSHAPVKRG